MCRCPDNFEGNPKVSCTPRTADPKIGCKAVSDCEPTKSCINNQCISPCNCGQNSECFVNNHVPVCRCKPGYSGNPLFGCVKIDCERDEQCDFDKTCSNNKCVAVCTIRDPCDISAICYGENHRSGNILYVLLYQIKYNFSLFSIISL